MSENYREELCMLRFMVGHPDCDSFDQSKVYKNFSYINEKKLPSVESRKKTGKIFSFGLEVIPQLELRETIDQCRKYQTTKKQLHSPLGRRFRQKS